MGYRVECSYCGGIAKLVRGADLYPSQPSLRRRRYYQCAPCHAHVGCHEKTNGYGDWIPLGTLANPQLRKLRGITHIAFDKLWKSGRMSRVDAYRFMATSMNLTKGQAHIAMFTEDQCRQLLSILKPLPKTEKAEASS